MTNEILILAGSAAALGFVHTILGPDHYLPFIVMAKARQWKMYKTMFKHFWVPYLCILIQLLS